MKRMVRALQGGIMPRAGLDLLGLMDVAQAVGKAGLRMMDSPPEQGRGDRHEQHDAARACCRTWLRLHPFASLEIQVKALIRDASKCVVIDSGRLQFLAAFRLSIAQIDRRRGGQRNGALPIVDADLRFRRAAAVAGSWATALSAAQELSDDLAVVPLPLERPDVRTTIQRIMRIGRRLVHVGKVDSPRAG